MPVGGTRQGVALLEADPELAAGLTDEEAAEAGRLLILPALMLEVGPWDPLEVVSEPTLGVLILEGLVTVNVLLGDRVASHLAGPGDVLHTTQPPEPLVPAAIFHDVSEPTRVAVLDRHFIAALRKWPALLVTLTERHRLLERRLAVHAAIGKQRRVHDRVLALLWHLAERFGRMTPDGVVVPLNLTHEAIGHLAGAERPTVSLALKDLAAAGEVTRRPDGAFILRQGSERMAALAAHTAPDKPIRIRAIRGHEPAPRPALVDMTALRQRLAVLREELPLRSHAVDDLLAASRATAERSAQTRERVAADRDARTTPVRSAR